MWAVDQNWPANESSPSPRMNLQSAKMTLKTLTVNGVELVLVEVPHSDPYDLKSNINRINYKY